MRERIAVYANGVYEASFDGNEIVNEFGEFKIVRKELGNLVCPNGNIVVCDPFMPLPQDAYKLRIGPGEYSLEIVIAHFGSSNVERIAAAMLFVSKKPPQDWKMATTPSQDVSKLERNQAYGFGVDSGISCVMDIDAYIIHQRKINAEKEYSNHLLAELDENRRSNWTWANVLIEGKGNLNLFMFSSGIGDGYYSSYWGYDENERPACLLVDFAMLIDWPEY